MMVCTQTSMPPTRLAKQTRNRRNSSKPAARHSMPPFDYANLELFFEILARRCGSCLRYVTCSLTALCREPLVKANGCSVVRTYVGHGINSSYHTTPNIPHYAKNKAIGTMKPGMVSTPISTQFLVILPNPPGIYNRACTISLLTPFRYFSIDDRSRW